MISIGEYTYGDPIIIGDGDLIIGKFCSIADNVSMILWGHRMDFLTTYPFGHSKYTKDCPMNQEHIIRGKIKIGNDVWIGTNVTIVYGSTIGDGAIIGAGSVVRGYIKPYSIVHGNPAQILKYRFDEEIIEILKKLKWWDLPYDIIKENYDILMSNEHEKIIDLYKKLNNNMIETILISPYSQKLRDNKITTPNPKTYAHWEHLVKLLKEKNYNIVQIGVEGEDKINGVDDFLKNLSFKDLEEKVKECKSWISVDNFFHHFCAYHKKPGIVLFSQSDPNIYGHKINKNLLKNRKYLRPDQFGIWESCTYNIDAYISPEEVMKQSNL